MTQWRGRALGFVFVAMVLSGCASQWGEGFGWTTMIDGEKGLGNWDRVGDANWRAIAGVIRADQRRGKDSAYLLSKQTYRDFEIEAEFWADADANSGIFVRCTEPAKISPATCYEVNIFDKRPDPSYGTGAVVDFAKVYKIAKAEGRWNTFVITARGDRLTVRLNGETTVDFRNDRFTEGPFALQYGSGVIKFRKVAIKPL